MAWKTQCQLELTANVNVVISMIVYIFKWSFL